MNTYTQNSAPQAADTRTPAQQAYAWATPKGLDLVPLEGKRPFDPGWQNKTYGASDLANWRGNLGVQCGRDVKGLAGFLLVVDVDGDEGERSLSDLISDWGDLPATLTVRTGSGVGRHLYFRTTKPFGSSRVKDTTNIDIRGVGGQVVAPHSLHPETGRTYDVAADLDIAWAPTWLETLLTPPGERGECVAFDLDGPALNGGVYAHQMDRKIDRDMAEWYEWARTATTGANAKAPSTILIAAGRLPYLEPARRRERCEELLSAHTTCVAYGKRESVEQHVREAVSNGAKQPCSCEDFAGRIEQEILIGTSSYLSPSDLAQREPVGALADVLDQKQWELAYRLQCERMAKDVRSPANATRTGSGDWNVQPAGWLTKQRPPKAWLVPDLRIASGRPNIITAVSGTGKSYVAQSILMALATGQPVWGKLPVARKCRVLHIDYEMGDEDTPLRYQALARGMGYDTDALEQNLVLAAMPRVNLKHDKAEQAFEDLVREHEAECVLIDSLLAACPGVDENVSNIREYLDILNRVSARTKTAMLVIHHSGKGETTALRGASAIKDASGVVYQLVPKGRALELSPFKRAGAPSYESERGPLSVEIVSVPCGIEPGMAVRLVDRDTAAARAEHDSRAEDAALDARILEQVRQAGSDGIAVSKLKGKRAADIRGALDALELAGKVARRKQGTTLYAVSIGT